MPRPLGLRIDCGAGTLWLTFDGDCRDVILDAGQSHLCDGDALLLIHAMTPAELRLAGDAATCP